MRAGGQSLAVEASRSLMCGPSLKCAPTLFKPPQAVELTAEGRQFFSDVFERFDVDDDSVLSPREYEELFATAPGE